MYAQNMEKCDAAQSRDIDRILSRLNGIISEAESLNNLAGAIDDRALGARPTSEPSPLGTIKQVRSGSIGELESALDRICDIQSLLRSRIEHISSAI